jgi:hypothetical protein
MADKPLKVNFTDKEAASEARGVDVLPRGKYHCTLYDIDAREVNSENAAGEPNKNAGKPYWALDFVVQDGPYEGRHIWTNCMLFDGALYTASQLFKSTGHEKALSTGIIPDPDDIIGKDVDVMVVKIKDTWQMKDAAPGEPTIFKNEVKGIAVWDGKVASAVAAPSRSGNPMLP